MSRATASVIIVSVLLLFSGVCLAQIGGNAAYSESGAKTRAHIPLTKMR